VNKYSFKWDEKCFYYTEIEAETEEEAKELFYSGEHDNEIELVGSEYYGLEEVEKI
jgi:hypothetical protein